MNVLVLGLGNVLLSDDGVGVHVVEALRQRGAVAENVELLDGGTAGIRLLDAVSDRDALIICDAVRVGQPPGSVVRLAGDEVPAYFRQQVSPHASGLPELLAALRLSGNRPPRMTLIGVVPANLELGTELSAAAHRGLERAVELVLEELARPA